MFSNTFSYGKACRTKHLSLMAAAVSEITLRVRAKTAPSIPPTCTIVPDFVEVRDSAIHGKGVFATRVLEPGTPLAKYAGEALTAAQLKERYPPPIHPAYVLQVGSRFIDASQQGGNWTRFINDSHGTTLKNNCRYNRAGNVEVTRRIHQGEELLASYGAGFWASARAEEESKRQGKKRPMRRRRISQDAIDHRHKVERARQERKQRFKMRQKRKRDSEAQQHATRRSLRARVG